MSFSRQGRGRGPASLPIMLDLPEYKKTGGGREEGWGEGWKRGGEGRRRMGKEFGDVSAHPPDMKKGKAGVVFM